MAPESVRQLRYYVTSLSFRHAAKHGEVLQHWDLRLLVGNRMLLIGDDVVHESGNAAICVALHGPGTANAVVRPCTARNG